MIREVYCIEPIGALVRGAYYRVTADVTDPFTKAPMVQLEDGSRFWAWRFTPGPPMPPVQHFRFG